VAGGRFELWRRGRKFGDAYNIRPASGESAQSISDTYLEVDVDILRGSPAHRVFVDLMTERGREKRTLLVQSATKKRRKRDSDAAWRAAGKLVNERMVLRKGTESDDPATMATLDALAGDYEERDFVVHEIEPSGDGSRIITLSVHGGVRLTPDEAQEWLGIKFSL
jgi:hypothetical protein